MTPWDKTLSNQFLDFLLKNLTFFYQNHFQKLGLTGIKIGELSNISYEHPRGSVFRKYRSQTFTKIGYDF